MRPRSVYFNELIQSISSLELALQENPSLISAQDESGKTLLHHAAVIPNWGDAYTRNLLQLLFNSPGLNFTIKDNEENTPLHIAALHCFQKNICQEVFPILISEAARRNFNFATLGQDGKSILHIAAVISYIDTRHGDDFSADTEIRTRINNVLNVLNNTPQPGLNVLSTSGSTAFAYAVERSRLDEANALLDAGANPALYGAPDKNPFVMIENHIQLMIKSRSSFAASWQGAIEHCNAQLLRYNALKTRMLSPSVFEINKNSIMLSLGARDHSSSLHNLPPEVLIKIAGFTATNGAHTQDSAEKIASKYFEQKSQSTLRTYSLYSREPNVDASNSTRSKMVESSNSNSINTPALQRSSCMNISYRR